MREKNTEIEDLNAKEFDETGLTPEQIEKYTEISITPENYFKIGLIYLRILAGLPVILMGETGIGKTSLIRLMAKIMDFPLKIFNVHAGITSK
jgi:MoxR-like ATPase